MTSSPIRKWIRFLEKGQASLEKLDEVYKKENVEEEEGELEEVSYSSEIIANTSDKDKLRPLEDYRELSRTRNGKKEGLFTVSDPKGSLCKFGKYRRGQVFGACWVRLEGGSWTISNSNLHNIFIYPDLTTVLVGEFDAVGKALSETEVCQVVGVGNNTGVPTPILSPIGSKIPAPLQDCSSTFCNQPFVSDPYEDKHVEVRESLIPGAGQGLFAKRNLEAGQLVAYFAGVQDLRVNSYEDSEYSISIGNGKVLDIPISFRSTYCGTLGHKACHSFQPSATYSYAVHPRFGPVRCLYALYNIQAGQEITTDYKYSIKKAPGWYKSCLLDFLVSCKGMSEEAAKSRIKQLDISDTRTNKLEGKAGSDQS